MRRTNIYLADEQCSALDELARSTGTSRAEIIRRLIDQAISSDLQDLGADLLAIDESFGALADDDALFERGNDARMRYLESISEK